MTTLSTMRSRVASELRRTNINTQIDAAIRTAIDAYVFERFWWNESRETTFNTVSGQWQYDEGDVPDLANILRWDYVLAEIGDSIYTLMPSSPQEIDTENSDGDFTGQPLTWAWYNSQFLIYPVPNDAFPIRIGGLIAKPAPASDAETGNPWMTHAEKLIRCRAKYELYSQVLMDPVQAAMFSPDNDTGPTAKALQELRTRTAWLTNQGGAFTITPTCF